jgi:hypothetical protein
MPRGGLSPLPTGCGAAIAAGAKALDCGAVQKRAVSQKITCDQKVDDISDLFEKVSRTLPKWVIKRHS